MKTMLFAWMTGFILITFEGGHMELSAQEPLPAVITRAPVLITPLQMEFLNTIYDTYTTGNSVREDGCLDFEGGFQNALDFLKSKIGSQYNDEFGFSGFDITVASTVVQADPPGMPDVVHARNGSIGIRSGKDVEKLFDEGPPNFGQPWIFASVQSRDCHSTIRGSAIHRVEVFDFSTVAYLMPLLQRSKWSFEIEARHGGNDIEFTRLKNEFQIPNLEDDYLMFTPRGLNLVRIGIGQGHSKLVVPASMQGSSSCERLEHVWSVTMKIDARLIVWPGRSTMELLVVLDTDTMGLDPNYPEPNLTRRCIRLDTGKSYIESISHKNHLVFPDNRYFLKIKNNRFADTYAMDQTLLARWKTTGAPPSEYLSPQDYFNSRTDFPLEPGSFSVNYQKIKLERHFSQTKYDQPNKLKQ